MPFLMPRELYHKHLPKMVGQRIKRVQLICVTQKQMNIRVEHVFWIQLDYTVSLHWKTQRSQCLFKPSAVLWAMESNVRWSVEEGLLFAASMLPLTTRSGHSTTNPMATKCTHREHNSNFARHSVSRWSKRVATQIQSLQSREPWKDLWRQLAELVVSQIQSLQSREPWKDLWRQLAELVVSQIQSLQSREPRKDLWRQLAELVMIQFQSELRKDLWRQLA